MRVMRNFVACLGGARRFLGEFVGYCDVSCEKGHHVDGNVWYADHYLYPNHWQPGSKVQPQLVDDGQVRSWFDLWAMAVAIRTCILILMVLLLLLFI
ncbi:hypothetical protein TcYC6_0121280 [Trypanosoma cruzi]|uniref:Uncharacterized protein n=1 Tax=Trypanosoma cruzi (strain CL Brener) TaxID=353153 RepID=Q4E148_TRYCC|nr:hypothetical protein, conserved [Trypanosoma cruzi]EAN98461.1 hypothetical protein, conserved [Trypanosoma cruzi]KAF8291271.1 hypothetical protein TcYC6_0121280 [Trypanosoma cruzi]|eukprot:XP_820312.1 hypothetical protein [Trypanosoma cruzi strain CL Brener]